MKSLEERRRDLLTESELNRQVLRLEFQQLQARLGRAREAWLHHAWTWAAPLAGFFIARKLTKTSGFVAKGSLAAVLLSRVWEFWQSRREKPAKR